MPIAPPKPCNRMGCAALVRSPDRYCETHRLDRQRQQTAARRADPIRRERMDFYSSSAWRRCRASYLGTNPLCTACKGEGRLTPATVVDHVVEIKQGGDRFDPANLQGLCASCHARKTAADGGRW
jgi:5-methylcytosine-specific restriction enzyme A